jgi:hypothetical protein
MALVACGDGTNPFDEAFEVTSPETVTPETVEVSESVVQADSGEITVTLSDDSVSTDAVTLTVEEITSVSGAELSGYAVQGDDVLAIGGLSEEQGFSGITGTTEAAPTADATFNGNYAVTTSSGQATGTIEMLYDFDNQILISVGGPLSVAAIESEGTLSGAATYAGETASLMGGFYPESRMAAAFSGATFGGVIFAGQ